MAIGAADYGVFGLMLTISGLIGVYHRFTGTKQQTNEDYLLGNRKQNPIAVAFSLMASFVSAISMLGGSSEVYTYGTHFFTTNIGYVLGFVISLLVYIPVFYKLGTISVYEYLELRFGKIVRRSASIVFTFQMLLYMSIVLVAPSTALQAVTGISHTASILICGTICVVYSTFGGMRAIISADVFQALMMYGSTLSVILTAYLRVGSFTEIWNIAHKYGRINHYDFSLDPTIRHTWFTTVIGGIFTSVILNGINQTQIQRCLTMKNYKTVVISMMYYAPLIVLISFLDGFVGLCVFSKYKNCDPLKEGRITSSDQITPLYVMDTFQGYGLTGVFVAGIFSASLSTISPLINSLAAVALEDYVKPAYFKIRKQRLNESTSVFVTKLLSFVYGSACVGIALYTSRRASILQAAMIIFGIVGGPMLGIFSLGMLTRFSNQSGSLAGFISGLIFTVWISIGGSRPKPKGLPTFIDGCSPEVIARIHANHQNSTSLNDTGDYFYLFRLSYMYYAVLGFLVTILVGMLASFLARTKSEQPDDRLLSPVLRLWANEKSVRNYDETESELNSKAITHM